MSTAESKAYEMIVGMILSRSFAPGDRLVESEIAQEIGLSRTPIRSAMRQLAAEGLLETRDNKGCYIPRLSPKDMNEVFKARAYIEGKLAFEAAYARTDDDISLMKQLLAEDKLYYSERRHREYAEVNKKIHLMLGKIARNSYLERFARQLFWRSELYIFFFDRFYVPTEADGLLRDPSKSVSCTEHDGIFSAIEMSDGEMAEQAARQHVYTSYSKMAGRVPKSGIAGM